MKKKPRYGEDEKEKKNGEMTKSDIFFQKVFSRITGSMTPTSPIMTLQAKIRMLLAEIAGT